MADTSAQYPDLQTGNGVQTNGTTLRENVTNSKVSASKPARNGSCPWDTYTRRKEGAWEKGSHCREDADTRQVFAIAQAVLLGDLLLSSTHSIYLFVLCWQTIRAPSPRRHIQLTPDKTVLPRLGLKQPKPTTFSSTLS